VRGTLMLVEQPRYAASSSCWSSSRAAAYRDPRAFDGGSRYALVEGYSISRGFQRAEEPRGQREKGPRSAAHCSSMIVFASMIWTPIWAMASSKDSSTSSVSSPSSASPA